MSRLKMSIAICTYNGELYLGEQLKSIANQIRQPDELVVCDDKSSDQTMNIIKKFSVSTNFPVRAYCNENNLGLVKNFEKAVSLCEGDVIVLADQDDVWMPEKLRVLEDFFVQSPETGMVFSNAEVVDQDLNPFGFSLWAAVGFSSVRRKQFEDNPFPVLLKNSIVTGATMAFRSKYRNLLFPFPRYYWLHDGWVALIVAAVAPVVPIDKKLILYRQHQSNQLGASKEDSSLKGQVKKARKWGAKNIYEKAKANAYVRIRLSHNTSLQDDKVLEYLTLSIRHLLVRRNVLKFRFAGVLMATLEMLKGRYHCYSRGWKSYIGDICRGVFQR